MNLPPSKILSESLDSDCKVVKIQVQLSRDLDFFDGHFDQVAILPAVAQLFMAQQYASKYLQFSAEFLGLRQLKFMSPITPETELELLLECHTDSNKLQFEYTSAAEVKSKGVFIFKSEVTHE